MDHAKAPPRTFLGMLVGAAVLAATTLFPCAAPLALEADSGGLLAPTLECEPAGSRIDASLLARVRATAPVERRRGSAKERHRINQRGVARKSGQPSTPRSARKAAPPASEEPQAAFLRSFYTCSAPRSSALTEGTGWRLVGPLRQG